MSESFQTAFALHQQGQIEEAETHYRAALEARPDHFEALNNLGLLLARQGKLDEAIALTRKAIPLAADNSETQSNLGDMLFRAGDLEEARQWLEKSLAQRPGRAIALMRLLRVLRAQNRSEEALPFLDNAVARRPQSAEIHQMRGALLNALGQQEEARLAFERAVAIRPNGHYFRDLAAVTKFTPDNKHIANMEAMQRSPNVPPDQAMALHFALGKAYADTRDYDHSFIHQIEANRRRRETTAYNETAEMLRFEKLKNLFTADVLRNRAVGDASDKPVFIVGMPRSGSTLVEQILASHPDTSAIGESPLWHKAVTTALGDLDFTDAPKDASDDQLRAIGANYVADITRLQPTAKRIVDKMLLNFLYVGLIHMALPNARIIHTMRDPVDTCLSAFAEEFPGGPPWLFELGELGRFWRAYAGLMDHWRSVLPEGVMLDVRYEDVVADLEVSARKIVAHIGLPWHAACLAFNKTQRPVWTASADQVRKPIYTTSIGRWRPSEKYLKPLLDALGE
ncbi:MAG TPA: sulfotransferase [Rhizomicrobium sp.]